MNRLTDTSPYSLWRGPVDLTSCDLEPVHRIGAVQSHGALLIFAADSGALLEASTNWREFLPTGSPSLEGLFSPSLVEQLLSLESSGRATLLSQTLPGEIEVSVLRLEDRLVVELESTRTALPFDPVAGLSTVMQALRGARSSEEYLRQLATELRRTLAIDHIMIYHFLPDWAGEVVAESSVDQVGYLGLRFPATDIPAPAREVFRQVWVRHIADVQAPAVPVQGEGARLTQLNLTQIGIRAASPVHLQYLANMNVRASLTLSLRLGDTLWGLVAGHHRSPYLLRPSGGPLWNWWPRWPPGNSPSICRKGPVRSGARPNSACPSWRPSWRWMTTFSWPPISIRCKA
jgi:chemotaxis family two-component system sensor kinase Cph1